ncbi:hypothetical protein NFI96_003130 [Prochilodus magdalenae]|nr:hypothetical protein NFI96_003130 [Prochilodus magdalenae]
MYLIVFHACFIMFMWSYWKTIVSKPSNPSKELFNICVHVARHAEAGSLRSRSALQCDYGKFCLPKAEKEQYEKEERPEAQQEILKKVARDLPIYTRTGSGAIRYCDLCQLIKPDRCHHCSTCDQCVLKMDHHCPWVNNCVGFSNYKFFVLFLGYSMLYCVFIAATVLQYFIKFWTLCRRRALEHCPEVKTARLLRSCDTLELVAQSSGEFCLHTAPSFTNQLPDNHAKFHVLFLFFVAAMFFISIMSLFTYHIWLVAKNRTTIEAFRAPVFRNGPDKNGFTLGFRKNLSQVFGDQKKYWCLPIYSSLGDGYTFPTRLVNLDSEQGAVDHQSNSISSRLRTTSTLAGVQPHSQDDTPSAHAGVGVPKPSPEGTTPLHNLIPQDVCVVDGQPNSRPLSDSQNRLLSNDAHSDEQKDGKAVRLNDTGVWSAARTCRMGRGTRYLLDRDTVASRLGKRVRRTPSAAPSSLNTEPDRLRVLTFPPHCSEIALRYMRKPGVDKQNSTGSHPVYSRTVFIPIRNPNTFGSALRSGALGMRLSGGVEYTD